MIERRPVSEDLRLTQGMQVPGPTGTYEILGLLGSGGSARVYLAQRRGWEDGDAPPSLCTLKVSLSDADGERLVAEGSLLASLQHGGVPRPLELFDWQGAICLATEHRTGRTLERLQHEAGGPLPVADVLEWAGQVCDILAYLHSQVPPVVHRDVKPGNLLLGDDGRILLLDFGASRLYDARKPGDTIALGSPEFAAPEQLQGSAQSTPAADLWGLGATCFHLLTGKGPDRLFTFPPLREALPEAPATLEAALERALRYSPEQRYTSAVEMKAALTRAREEAGRGEGAPVGSPVAAEPPAALPVTTPPRRPVADVSPTPPGLSRLQSRRPASRADASPRPTTASPDRLVLLASVVSPVVSAAIVALTIYLATASRSPFAFTQQALSAVPVMGSGGMVEAGLGSLVVSTVPSGAVVELDGVPLQNRTPVQLSRVVSGAHRLRVSLPGYADTEQSIEVQGGDTRDITISLTPLLQLAVGHLEDGEAGPWSGLTDGSISASFVDLLAVRLGPPPGADASASPVTLQVVLRSGDGSSRTAFSGPYLWGQARLLRPGRLSPGVYTVEATVLGADLPPMTTTVPLTVRE